MAESLRDFLGRREQELLAELKPAESVVASIKHELREIRAATKALNAEDERGPGEPSLADLPIPAMSFPVGIELLTEPKTIKEMALHLLENDVSFRRYGATSGELRDAILSSFRKDIPITSLSPQLSRLRDEKQIWAQNNRWKFLNRVIDLGHVPTIEETIPQILGYENYISAIELIAILRGTFRLGATESAIETYLADMERKGLVVRNSEGWRLIKQFRNADDEESLPEHMKRALKEAQQVAQATFDKVTGKKE